MVRNATGELLYPDYKGSAGRAWELPIRLGRHAVKHSAALGGWLVDAPLAHAFWRYHTATLVHLREVPGVEPPIIVLPGATHELMMWALDPAFDHQIDPSVMHTMTHMLTPIDFAEQFTVRTDRRALDIARLAIQRCINGELLPDTDSRQAWGSFLRSQPQ